jgi:hypothetical protein
MATRAAGGNSIFESAALNAATRCLSSAQVVPTHRRGRGIEFSVGLMRRRLRDAPLEQFRERADVLQILNDHLAIQARRPRLNAQAGARRCLDPR